VARFSSFVIVAEMRTGSNLLEARLNALSGVHCHGELFNPSFVGQPDCQQAFGVDAAERDRDPAALFAAMVASGPGLHGFRWFRDHDPRVLGLALDDPGCAIVRLTRSPVDAYVSRKIALATGQWRLGDLKDRKAARARFDAAEFAEYLGARDSFERTFRRRLQIAGQSAFGLTYEDLGELGVLNGLAAWLGVDARLDALPAGPRKQNPGALRDRVENHEEMAAALTGMGLDETASDDAFRARLGPSVPRYLAAAQSPLLFQPVAGGPVAEVTEWLTRLDGAPPVAGHRQNTLRDWQARHPGHRAFTVIRHPLVRAFHVFRDHLLAEDGRLRGLVPVLARHGVALASPQSTPQQVRGSFIAWLEFLGGAIAAQTSLSPDPLWLPQTAQIEGFSAVRPPDRIIREDEIETGLASLADRAVAPPPPDADLRAAAQQILTPRIGQLVRRLYRRDFLTFGFGDLGGP
jgi:hypothetical protein